MALVTQDSPDLTARQMAVLLTVVQQKGPHTVRGLAAQMRIPKPSTTRAIDVLQGHKYVTRTIDPSDRRSVLIDATEIGRSFLLSLQPAPAKEMAR
jgi:DNA-binding MarR family transcriptional regulator